MSWVQQQQQPAVVYASPCPPASCRPAPSPVPFCRSQAYRPGTTVDQHVQLLYAAALERLAAPIPPAALRRALAPLQAHHAAFREQEAAAAAAEEQRARAAAEAAAAAARAAAEAEAAQREAAERHRAEMQVVLLTQVEHQHEDLEYEAAADELTASIAAVLPPLAPLPARAAEAAAAPEDGLAAGGAAAAPAAAAASGAVPAPLPTPLIEVAGVPASAPQLAALPAAAAAPAEGGMLRHSGTVAGSSNALAALGQAQPAGALAALGSSNHLAALAPGEPGSPAAAAAAAAAARPAAAGAAGPAAGPAAGAAAGSPAAVSAAAVSAGAAAESGPSWTLADEVDLETVMLDFEEGEEDEQQGPHQPQLHPSPGSQQHAAAAAAAAGPLGGPQLLLAPAPGGAGEQVAPPAVALPDEAQLQQLQQHTPELQAAALLVLFCLHVAHPPLPKPGLASAAQQAAGVPGAHPAAAAEQAGGSGGAAGAAGSAPAEAARAGAAAAGEAGGAAAATAAASEGGGGAAAAAAGSAAAAAGQGEGGEAATSPQGGAAAAQVDVGGTIADATGAADPGRQLTSLGGGGRVRIYVSSEHQQALLGEWRGGNPTVGNGWSVACLAQLAGCLWASRPAPFIACASPAQPSHTVSTPPSHPCTDLVPRLGAKCPDALAALRQLRSSGALVLGATRRPAALPEGSVAGTERLMLVPGLSHGERSLSVCFFEAFQAAMGWSRGACMQLRAAWHVG